MAAGKIMAEIGDDDLVTLNEACDLFFGGRLTKSSLRLEASRGNLEIIRIANKDFVTRNGIRRMIDRCRLPAKDNIAPKPVSDPGITAQNAAKVRLAKLKKDLKIDDLLSPSGNVARRSRQIHRRRHNEI